MWTPVTSPSANQRAGHEPITYPVTPSSLTTRHWKVLQGNPSGSSGFSGHELRLRGPAINIPLLQTLTFHVVWPHGASGTRPCSHSHSINLEAAPSWCPRSAVAFMGPELRSWVRAGLMSRGRKRGIHGFTCWPPHAAGPSGGIAPPDFVSAIALVGWVCAFTLVVGLRVPCPAPYPEARSGGVVSPTWVNIPPAPQGIITATQGPAPAGKPSSCPTFQPKEGEEWDEGRTHVAL